MQRSYKYRIFPTKEQTEKLNKTFRFCRFLYNCALEERINFYKQYAKSLSYNSQANELSEVKKNFTTETDIIYSQVLQQVLKQLDKAYSNFFRRIKSKASEAGFPRFKNEYRFRSICYPQVKPDLLSGCVKRLPNNKLYVSGIGDLKVKWHRPFQGRCKQVRISKQSDRYYITLSCDQVPQELLPQTGKTVAIDLGLTNFITMDDGTTFHHPKPYKTAREKLAWLNRRLALKKKGSNNRRKAILSIQKESEHISNIRADFQHKLSKQIVKNNDIIIIEKLNIKSMLENKGYEVNKQNIADASWGNFVALLLYKAESAGKEVREVNPKNTSKMCSSCGNVKQSLTLRDREYKCGRCPLVINRDLNAALNIKRLGINLATSKTVSEANDFSRW